MILVAGHYCHDTILSNAGERKALGGSAAYASAILDAFQEPYEVAAKAGPDFLYAAQVTKQPRIVQGQRTSSFVDDYRHGERRDHVEAVCEPLFPGDLQGTWDIAIACAVTGEVPLPTLQRMRQLSRVVLADAQGLLREITETGDVVLRPLRPEVPHCLDYLKASRSEAALLDTEALRNHLTLLITDGPRGCDVLTKDSTTHIPAFPASELDPTGAGDCFLAGFAVGLARGFELHKAARLGAWCGARAVEHAGVPRIKNSERQSLLARWAS